ncbi:ABC transporter ATP-binding protein [Paenibacillus puerhi]|uniref:ABC transporter ATP-binding protein n=1 Tax=Paenibacillus puerhi TaxID=2692622 RepID=UPI001358A30B|nr:ABC transporter ATP-binding protein [Paenibacillus puerhi]
MTFFCMSHVSFQYSKKTGPVIRDFSLQAEQGEVVGILGNSGSGKSTLLRLIAGLDEPCTGRIALNGRVLADQGVFVNPEHRGIGMVFQDYGLFPHLTVEQNIRFGMHRMGKREREEQLLRMLELVQLQDFRHRYPHELSGGQQQRVAFARALAPGPSMLLMDEPFSNLDAGLKGSIREELKELLLAARTTSILVTHDEEDAKVLCSRIIHMSAEPLLYV